jgi:hypothetical protein
MFLVSKQKIDIPLAGGIKRVVVGALVAVCGEK